MTLSPRSRARKNLAELFLSQQLVGFQVLKGTAAADRDAHGGGADRVGDVRCDEAHASLEYAKKNAYLAIVILLLISRSSVRKSARPHNDRRAVSRSASPVIPAALRRALAHPPVLMRAPRCFWGKPQPIQLMRRGPIRRRFGHALVADR